MGNVINMKTVSSLEKVLVEQSIDDLKAVDKTVMLANEKTSIQIAYTKQNADDLVNHRVYITLESPIKEYLKFNRVIQMACPTPIDESDTDEYMLRTEGGLIPDLLLPVDEKMLYHVANHALNALWIDVEPEGRIKGEFPITVVFTDRKAGELDRYTTYVEILDMELPEQETIHTEWFYCDCLKSYYGTETWDERHWNIIENFMKTATAHGINMILTPLFTYALDTAVGGERPTTQLVSVEMDEQGNYSFEFSLLDRFVATAKRAGYKYFEMSHFFTQWGAKATPKIMAKTPEGTKRIFGWDVASTDQKYYDFLGAFIPELLKELDKLGILEVSYFHLSDEPSIDNIEDYKKCYDYISTIIPKNKIMDAMSNLEFYKEKVIERPIPSTRETQKFIDAKVPGLWTYYCCTARNMLSNRYFAMPLHRTRVIGMQIYINNIVGFLHWGYNFYFSQYSMYPINPFLQTDCDGFAESGDAFLVYPGPDGVPYESIRLKAMRDAMTDIRLCKLLESKKGREVVDRIISEELGTITFKEYPREADAYINFRNRVLSELQK